jgi:hypothetical protein
MSGERSVGASAGWDNPLSVLLISRENDWSIDVRPRSEASTISPNSTNNINVAIFSINGFDAATVDPNTVRFGPTGTEAAPIHVGRRDVDGDGRRDMVVVF